MALFDFKIECSRKYGEPKLKKSTVCKNENLDGTVFWSDGQTKCACKVWTYADRIYVLHRDWFSKSISIPEALKRGLLTTEKKKFIYNDNFGGVILRNEAIISFNVPPLDKFILDNCFSLVKEFAEMLGDEWCDLYLLHRWEDFFEAILKLKMNKEVRKCM
jgi:hypothetical protein